MIERTPGSNFEFEGAGAVALGEVRGAIGDDHEMVQGQNRWQVGIRICKRDFQGALVDSLEAGHLGGDLGDLGADGRIEMAFQRVDHVVGGQRLAVMEGNAGTQFYRPGLGIFRFDGFGQFHLRRAGNIEEAQPVVERAAADIVRG